jgi:glycosyltransferase involved in cell wall biosynthesis
LKDRNETDRPVLSIVIPLYNEADNVEALVRRLEGVLDRLGCRWEFVFALDPSPDGTREKILALLRAGHPVRLITFSRRIGKPLSLLAGLDHCRGDACVIIDADLQDPPELIEEMYRKWQEGFEVVIPQRVSRQGENYLYLKAAETFYWLLDKVAEVRVPRNTGDFRLLDARVVREVCRFRERHGFLRGISAAAGFRTTVIPYHRDARLSGKTQIPLSSAINIALAGGASLAWIAAGLITGFSYSWPFMALAILGLLLSGLVLSCMGVLGEYLLRAYEDCRDRPLYIVDTIEEAQTLPRPLVSGEPSGAAKGMPGP